MSESMLQQLYAMTQKVDLGRVGLNNTTEVLAFYDGGEQRFIKYIDRLKQFGIASAMMQKGAIMTEAAYIIRDLSPMEDLLTNGKKIKHNQWIQDTFRIGKDDRGYYSDIYHTDFQVRHDQKTIMVYGIELLNPFSKEAASQKIEFWRDSVKLISWYDIGSLPLTSPIHYQNFILPRLKEDDGAEIEANGNGMMFKNNLVYANPTIYFTTPILYKRGDLMKVRVRFSNDKQKLFERDDEIKIKGFVVENIGTTMMG